MHTNPSSWARSVLAIVLVATLSGCGLPRVGPSKAEISAGSVERRGNASFVAVDPRVTRATSAYPALGFSNEFVEAGVLGSDTIRPGDTLGLTIYENVDDGLLVPPGAPATDLEQVQVDGDGFIFVPYAGRIRAAGNSPEAVRRLITERLARQTPDPQVQVRRLQGDGATVSVSGGVGAQGIYPIERPTRTLSAMLARAGGIAVPDEVAQVTVIRGARSERVWYEDLYKHPRHDIALRDGDRILVEQDERSFTALGATGRQLRVPFEHQTLSAIEAIAQVGGLDPGLADPSGVFVFRDESEAIARQVLGRPDLQGPQRIVYLLDLTEPTGLFEARDFAIRDEDTIYVTEAPYVRWRKILSVLTGTAGTANNITRLGN